jgi:colanic acid/amylovoran biosynthesis glycosyltransferase
MKFAIIAKEFPKTSETFVISQARGLISLGHDVGMVSIRQPRENLPEDFRGRSAFIGKPGIAGFLKRYFGKVKSKGFPGKKEACNFLENADIILIHYGDLAYSLLETLVKIKARMVVVFHGVDVARHLPALSANERSKLWDAMSLGLPVSGFFRDRLISLGCPSEKLIVHHMGIDTVKFPYRKKIPGEAGLKLLSVCRLVDKKGLDIAVKALAILNRRNPSFRVLYDIIGDGPEMKNLAELAQSLGVSEKIIFHGSAGQDEIQKYLAESDVFVLPSRTSPNGDMEGIPVSLMEAMSCGLAVISTFHSGIPELIDNGVSGLLVPENDDKALAEAIYRFIENNEKITLLGEKARYKIETYFNLDTLNIKLEKVILSLL